MQIHIYRKVYILLSLSLMLLCCKKPNPEKGIAAAIRFEKQKEMEKAIKILDEVIKDHPKFLKAYTYKSYYLSTIPGRENEAVEAISKSIELDSLCDYCYSWRGTITYGSEAMRDLDKAILINPKSYENYYSRAQRKHEEENYKGAIADFDSAIKYCTNLKIRAGLYTEKAYSHVESKDFIKAEEAYKISLNIDPTGKDNIFGLGILYLNINIDSSYFYLNKAKEMGLDSTTAKLADEGIRKIEMIRNTKK